MSDSRRDPHSDFNKSRNTNGNNNVDKIKAEVDRLVSKKGNISREDIQDLYNKYDEDIVDIITAKIDKRFQQVREKAKKLAQKVYDKYITRGKPMHEILSRLMEYKEKNEWTDTEYDEFRKELAALFNGTYTSQIDNNQHINVNRSRINRLLGTTRYVVDEGLKIKDADQGILAEIIDMYNKSLSLSKAVYTHSLVYEDCSPVAMTGEFNRNKHIASNYITPVLACMFLPKIDVFETNMLRSNFGAIVKARNDKTPIVDEPNTLLLSDISVDPNDVVCDSNNPLADLRNRYKVQISLWETVMKLRNGNYYDSNSNSEFMTALNYCRNNLYDNADLAFTQDEGSIMKRLLSVFSLRPTVIYSKPLSSLASFMSNPAFNNGLNPLSSGFLPFMGQQNNPQFNAIPAPTISTVSMMALQIPHYAEKNAEPIDIRSSIYQTIWLNKGQSLVPKEQSVIYSKGVLIFYVNRRSQSLKINTYNNFIPFSRVPITLEDQFALTTSNIESLNNYPVSVPERLTLNRNSEVFSLRSVVAVNEISVAEGSKVNKVISGSTGLIMTHRNFDLSMFDPKYYLYDPYAASIPVRNPDGGYFTNKPISYLEPVFTPPIQETGGILNLSFADRASRYGTVFIYAKPAGFEINETIIL